MCHSKIGSMKKSKMPSLDFLKSINNKKKIKKIPYSFSFLETEILREHLREILVCSWWIWKDQGVVATFEARVGRISHLKGN